MKTRYWKVTRDLTSGYGKNLMLVLAIAIGVFGVGSILGGYSVISREMTSNYMSTDPASATIEIEGDISPELVDSVKKFPGIKDAERRATVTGRMKIEGRWYPILLFVMDDFNQLRLNKFHLLSGTGLPSDSAMLVERTALGVMRAKETDVITIRTPNGKPHSLSIAGTVHDPGLAPAWQEQAGYGYISLAALHRLGETQGFDLLRIQVSEDSTSAGHITERAEALATWLKQKGYEVHDIQVPPPGKHPHQSQMNAVLSIFTIFCFMILILGSILVATSMATLMVKQVRQIGVMKTIGGTSVQIAGLYLLMILILCIVALMVSIPLSRIAAAGFYSQIATLLNLEIKDASIPNWVPLVQIASGIMIPFMAAAVPVTRGSNISVRKALDNYGVSAKGQTRSFINIFIARISFLNDTLQLALRNTFRQRVRLLLTLGLLAAGGAMFMTALNVSDAWDKNLKKIYIQRLYDQEIRLNERMDADAVIKKINNIEGVKLTEGWDYSSTSIANGSDFEISRTYPDKGHGSFMMLALPIPTKLLNPMVTEGCWLTSSASNDVVLNQLARTEEMKIGDSVELTVEGKPRTWRIIGFTEDVGSSATAYVSIETFRRYTSTPGKIRMLRIAYNDRSYEAASAKSNEIDKLLEQERISVNASVPVWLLHNAVAAHMRVLVNSLLTMAILMALVGTMGLTSTINMNVLERIREIGVMRAIGATPMRIRNMIAAEGMAIGLMSLLVAFLFSLLLSNILGEFIGHISFRTPLSLTVSISALLIWTGIVLVGSYAATLYPARRANKITTREALAYE